MSHDPYTSSSLRLCEAYHSGKYRILSVQTDRESVPALSQRGIEQGRTIEVIYNNRMGTVLVETGRMAIILGRACSFRIQLLPLAKPEPAEEAPPAKLLPEPIPLRIEAES